MISCYQTVAKFKSRNGNNVYYVRQDSPREFSCNCDNWKYYRKCKHVEYVKNHPYVVLDAVPTYQEAVAMVWGNDRQAKERWVINHLKAIVI